MKKLLFMLSIAFVLNTNAQYTKLYNFSSSPPRYGSLVSDGTYLYGMTEAGNTNYVCSSAICGFIYKIKPDGSSYDTLMSFHGYTNGSDAWGSLIYDGTFLYGMTRNGGTSTNCSDGCGTIFKIKPDGSGFIKLHDFGSTLKDGSVPYGDLYYDGIFLYGMTSAGGTNNYGIIFKIMPNGTGYDTLMSFNKANGWDPKGSLISDGTYLYGMTGAGGTGSVCSTSGCGLIFKIKPDGSSYDTLMNFRGINGSQPYGDLYYDGTFLYGMTSVGGTNNDGIIFKIMPNGSGYDTLMNFRGANGRYPQGSLISDGTFLYGLTSTGSNIAGGSNYGNIFKIMPNGTGFANLHYFGTTTDGESPTSTLFLSGGCLYGTTPAGGTSGNGTIFSLCGVASGIEQITSSNNKITIYPNPNNGSFVIEPNSTTKQSVQVYDVNGKLVLSQTISGKTSVDAGSLNEGVYNISIISNEGVVNKRLVIVR